MVEILVLGVAAGLGSALYVWAAIRADRKRLEQRRTLRRLRAVMRQNETPRSAA